MDCYESGMEEILSLLIIAIDIIVKTYSIASEIFCVFTTVKKEILVFIQGGEFGWSTARTKEIEHTKVLNFCTHKLFSLLSLELDEISTIKQSVTKVISYLLEHLCGYASTDFGESVSILFPIA